MVMEIIISVILLFVGISILMIIHVCVVGRAFRGDSRPAFVAEQSGTAAGMNPEEIKDLPWLDCNGNGHGSCPAECAICLEMFRPGDRCRILPGCGHCFHADCIDSWLMKTAACPVCRAGVVRSGHDRESFGQDGGVELV